MKVTLLITVLLSWQLAVSASPVTFVSADSVTEKWGVFELTVSDSSVYNNPFWDVMLTAEFSGPGGANFSAEGFYYEGSLWKLRFSPTETGTWHYTVNFTGASGTTVFTDSFTCTPPSAQNHGFIHVNPDAPHTFIQDDGTGFMPIGTNGNCPAVTAALLGMSPGPLQVSNMWDTLSANHINTYRLFMYHQPQFTDSLPWNSEEGSANLLYNTAALDKYNIRSCKLIVRWFRQTQDHGIAVYLCLMQIFDIPIFPFNTSPWYSGNGGYYNLPDDMYADSTSAGLAYQKKYVAYVVNRWGAFRNLVAWEYNNEYGVRCSMPWLRMMDSVIKGHDPYNRPHTVSFWDFSWSLISQANASPYVTVTDDHLYELNGWNEFNADSVANAQAQYRFSHFNKPVVFSEFGSGEGYTNQSDAVYERLSYWGAFTGGGTPIFWQSGDNSPNGWAYNNRDIHFLHAVSKVAARFAYYEQMIPVNNLVAVSMPGQVRVHCSSDSVEALAYFHHYTDHSMPVSGVQATFTFPELLSFTYDAVWINASTGDSVFSEQGTISGNAVTLTIPDFTIDLLVYVRLTNRIVGIPELQPAVFQPVYPNPSPEKFTIELPEDQTFRLTISNLAGCLLQEKNKQSGKTEIDLGDLPAGIYILKAFNNKSILIFRLLKE